LSIKNGDIVWVHGPFKCGAWPDINIFRNSLQSHLSESERVEADDGYLGGAPQYIKCPASFANPSECEAMQQMVRSHQEHVNARLKNFGCLRNIYRHNLGYHADVFRACAILIQLAINDGEKLFQVVYDDALPAAEAERRRAMLMI
jgi:DDE superfamily endonuclease